MAEPQPAAPEAPQPSIEERIAASMIPEEAPQAPAEEVVAEEDVTELSTADPEPAEASTAEESAEEEAVNVSSLTELSEYLGIDKADLYNLTFPVTVGHEKKELTLSEIKDNLQAQEEVKRIQDEAKALREETSARQKAAEEQYKQQLAQGAALVQSLEQQILQGMPSEADMKALRQSNPAEWAAKQAEMERARAQVNQLKAAVGTQIQQYQQNLKQEQEAALQEKINVELEALHRGWPELADESKGQAEKSALIDFLKQRGFSDSEIAEASDHRVLLLARDAMRHSRDAKTNDATKKKVLKIAKRVVTPGAKQSRQEQADERLQPIRARLRKSGDVKDAAALISALRR